MHCRVRLLQTDYNALVRCVVVFTSFFSIFFFFNIFQRSEIKWLINGLNAEINMVELAAVELVSVADLYLFASRPREEKWSLLFIGQLV